MAKRTKRKNNKLSKRKYSRGRLSRHRVNKKKLSRRRVTKKEKLSRRRIYQEKYRQSGGSGDDWDTQLRSQLVQRNKKTSVVAEQYPQTEVGPIKVFIYSDGGGNPKHIYEEKEQIQLTGAYGKNSIIHIHPAAGSGEYVVRINENKEAYLPNLYISIPMSNGEWCTVTEEIGTQTQVEDPSKTRKVFVGIKNEIYPGDLYVVDEYSIIKNKFGGLNSITNLVFAATSKDSEPTHVYFISDELKSKHFTGVGGKLLILMNPPKTPEEYNSRTKETRNVDGSTPSDPSLSGWRVKHWKSDHWTDERCPYGGGITEQLTLKGGVDYETPNGIILLFSPGWPEGNVGTKFSETISFDGGPMTRKIEPIKIILGDRRNDPRRKEKFNELFKQLSIVTKPIKEIQRFLQPTGVYIVVSRGSVVDFGVDKSWDPTEIAIVNAANMGGLGGGGVDGAITTAGGPRLAIKREKLPVLGVSPNGSEIRIQTGDAVLTGPGNYGDLHAANVIHAVGPDYRGIAIPEGNTLLQRAYEQSMRVAQVGNIKYIGFSLLSSGIFRGEPARISLDKVLKIGIDTVKDNLYEGLSEVHFVAFSQEEEDTLISLLQGNSLRIEPSLGPDLEPEPEPEQ